MTSKHINSHFTATLGTAPAASHGAEHPGAATVDLAARLLRLQVHLSRHHIERQAPLDARAGGAARAADQSGFESVATVAAALDAEIRDSVWRDAFYYDYQPIVCTRTGVVKSYEALLRWRRKGHIVSPAFFLPVAEETRSIIAIQQQLLTNVAAVYAELSHQTSIAINWSPTQLADPRAVSGFIDRARELQIDPKRIALEITERTVAIDPDATCANILRLKEQGFLIALDDFGKGYCGLGYLGHLPIDYVKIDGSLIVDLGESPRANLIVEAIVQLAHRLGSQVVAECVQTERQLSLLRSIGCDYVQGYLLGRPSRLPVPNPACAHSPQPGVAVPA